MANVAGRGSVGAAGDEEDRDRNDDRERDRGRECGGGGGIGWSWGRGGARGSEPAERVESRHVRNALIARASVDEVYLCMDGTAKPSVDA